MALRFSKALIALDLPAFERPATATSRPSSGGNWPGRATLLMNSTSGNWLTKGTLMPTQRAEKQGVSVQSAAHRTGLFGSFRGFMSYSTPPAARSILATAFLLLGLSAGSVAAETRGDAAAGATKAAV